MKIYGTMPLNSTPFGDKLKAGNADGNKSFQDILKNMLSETNSLLNQADDTAIKLAAGQVANIHDAMILAEKASIALQLTVQVRNKILDSYQEIMRMQL